MLKAQLGVDSGPRFRGRVAADGFVAKDDPADMDFLDEAAAAMVDEAGVMIADDPHPVEPRR